MSTSIKKVALIGASGNLGPAVLEKLVEARFDVTVLTRTGSQNKYPANVTVKEVDYDSTSSLTSALTGQDAVVSTIASAALGRQLAIVEAAAAAGVKRFLPSEFGSNTPHEKTSKLPCFGDKIAVQNKLKEIAGRPGGMTWTVVCTGAFFDWGMMVGLLMHPKSKSITFYDGGERKFSTTTLPAIGQAVAGVLSHPGETKNRVVYVNSAAISLKELQRIGKNAIGSEGWNESHVSTKELEAQGWEELGKPNPNPENFVMNFIKTSVFGEGYGMPFSKVDNELLGVKELNEKEIEDLVRAQA